MNEISSVHVVLHIYAHVCIVFAVYAICVGEMALLRCAAVDLYTSALQLNFFARSWLTPTLTSCANPARLSSWFYVDLCPLYHCRVLSLASVNTVFFHHFLLSSFLFFAFLFIPIIVLPFSFLPLPSLLLPQLPLFFRSSVYCVDEPSAATLLTRILRPPYLH